MEIANLTSLIACLLYGFSGFITVWVDYKSKLINSISLIYIIVLTIVTLDDPFYDLADELYLDSIFNFILPITSVAIGYFSGFKVKSFDWKMVSATLAVLAAISSIILAIQGK